MAIELCTPQAIPVSIAGTPLRDRALELDCRIDASLGAVTKAQALARANHEVGRCLCELHVSMGYRYLGYDTWEAYLRSKSKFCKRTHLSFLLKLGQAGDLSKYIKWGISASAFVEYAKATDIPEMIPALIEETWDALKDSPVREIHEHLKTYVLEHECFRQENRNRRGRKALGPIQKLLRAYEELGPSERKRFVREILERHCLKEDPTT